MFRTEALQRAGNASDYDFEKMFELGTIETHSLRSCAPGRIRTSVARRAPDLQSGAIDRSATDA